MKRYPTTNIYKNWWLVHQKWDSFEQIVCHCFANVKLEIMNFRLQRKYSAKDNIVTQNAQKCSTLKTANVWCSPLSFSPLLYSQCLWLSISLAYNIHPGFSAIFDNRSFDTQLHQSFSFRLLIQVLYKFFHYFFSKFLKIFAIIWI